MKQTKIFQILSIPLLSFSLLVPAYSNPSYVEPGTMRLSHELSLEGVFNKLRPGWKAQDSGYLGLDKTYIKEGNEENPWKSEWGASLLSDAAIRLNPDIFGRVLFEIQGDYPDRFWRPINIRHYTDQSDDHIFLREALATIDKDAWYLHGFAGIDRPTWEDRGDFFGLYRDSFAQRDYLGSSGQFGVYPNNWKQDQFLNISRRNVSRGAEGGAKFWGLDGVAAYGNELSWGFRDSFYTAWKAPMGTSMWGLALRNEDVPYSVYDPSERNRAGSLSWAQPFDGGHQLDLGVLYNPFRLDETYIDAENVGGGNGALGSNYTFSQKTTSESDAFGARLKFEANSVAFKKLWVWSVDLEHRGAVAGNKNQADLNLSSEFFPAVKGFFQFIYRKPVVGPLPFVYEGAPNNQGAIVSNPRGPESPFTVGWDNREAKIFLMTIQVDPTPGNNFFVHNPHDMAVWNMNPEEDSKGAMAFQWKMSDYPTTTDRQYYYDEKGDVVWEPAGHSGAWATKEPIHELKLLGRGEWRDWTFLLGLAGGQSLARLGLAYGSADPVVKSITEYFSMEGRAEIWPVGLWWHYGEDVWGPEENIDPYFGTTFDRLWGLGVSYNITKKTTWDISYIGARQDDDVYAAYNLGSYDEIRTVFSHRFGFLFQFKGPSRRGYQSR